MNIIFVSELAQKALIEFLKTKGTVILIPKDDRFDPRISSHPDLIIAMIDDVLIIDKNASSSIFEQLDHLDIPYIVGDAKLSATYPSDVAYNAVITSDYLIHNFNYTNPLLLMHCKNKQKTLLPVKQGYTKCSTVVVNEDTIITSDKGIHLATKNSMNTLLIETGHVSLEGHEYGFLGGTSGAIDDMVVFHGDLSKHPDFLRIEAFIKENNKELIYFDNFPLTDIGSILVFPYQKKVTTDSSTYHKHVNIPIFISHEGCPNDCVFCNQRKITAKTEAMSVQEISEQIKTYSSTLDEDTFVELAFFGGSFTGIDPCLQETYLKLAYEYKKSGLIQAIRLSTRPDYISKEILDRLKFYEVDTIELGVQSINEEVLAASNRGHKVSDLYKAVELIKAYDFHLGIQLMVGLPEDSKDRAILSSKLAALLKPDFIRIYPTLVIKETELLELCNQGKYTPLSLEEAVDWTKEMYLVFINSHIPVIRMGLQPTELIAEGKEVLYGPFHPAFRQLVESAYFLDLMKSALRNYNEIEKDTMNIQVRCNPKDLSQVIGHKRMNIIELKKEYPNLQVIPDEGIQPMKIQLLTSFSSNM